MRKTSTAVLHQPRVRDPEILAIQDRHAFQNEQHSPAASVVQWLAWWTMDLMVPGSSPGQAQLLLMY